MEMQNNVDLLQLHTTGMSDEYDGGFNIDLDELLLGDDYYTMNCLTGSDVNLADFDLLEPQERFSTIMEEPVSAVVKSETLLLKSPWHESDSGVSETLSFTGSPSDQTPSSKVAGEEIFQTERTAQKGTINLPLMSTTRADDDLVTFIFDTSRSNERSFANVTEDYVKNDKFSSSGRLLRKCGKRKLSETKVEYSADTTSTDSDDSSSGVHLGHVESTKPSTALSRTYKNLQQRCANVINVVKVVKPPAYTSDAMTKDIIIKALDDRSKKNAQQAKVNREKKKIYIKKLEDERESLMKENSVLSSQIKQMTGRMLNLETEVEYLKSVLANDSALSGLLKNISNVKEVKLSASITSNKRLFENDHSYNIVKTIPEKRARISNKNYTNAGVCLHVSNGEACIEFCAHCSSLARKTHKGSGES